MDRLGEFHGAFKLTELSAEVRLLFWHVTILFHPWNRQGSHNHKF